MITTIHKKLTRTFRRIQAVSLAAAFIFGGSGCSKEGVVPVQEIPGTPVLMNISNRAFGIGTTDEQVNTLRILLVAKNIDQTVACNRFVNNPTSNPLTVEVVGGNYDVYVMANETHNGQEHTPLTNVRNLARLKSIALPYDPDHRNMTNIPMFGEVKNVTITPQPGASASTNPATVSVDGASKGTNLPVSLFRMACKVNLTLFRMGGKSLKAVEFTNLPDAIPFFADTYITPGTRPVKAIAVNEVTNTGADNTLYPTLMEQIDILLPAWVFDPSTDAAQAVQLKATVTETINSTDTDQSYTCVIGHDAGSTAVTKDYTLWRNYNYTLTAFITNRTIRVCEAEVEVWVPEDLEVEGDNPAIPSPSNP